MMKKKWLCFFAGICTMFLQGKEVAEQVSDWNMYAPSSSKITQIRFEGENVLEVRGKAQLQTKEFFSLNPKGIWKLSGEFRAVPGCGETRFYYGFIPFDAQKIQIKSGEFTVVKDTLTKVKANAKKGDTVLILENASKWKTGNIFSAAFMARTDLFDLPNRNLSSGIKKITENPDGWQIEFAGGLPCDVPSGTLVREHRHGSSYAYAMAGAVKAPEDWTPFTALVRGQANDGVMTFSKFWPKTRYIRLGILVNPAGKDQPGILFRNLIIEEITR